jgi:predicted nucleotidyltransferase
VDLRGAHVLPVEEVVGLKPPRDTIEAEEMRDGLEVELVTHDVEKFFRLLLKKNGYVLEQLYSPLVVRTTPEHEELKRIARGCITRHHAHHYLGFSRNQWRLFEKEQPPRVKPLLYTYRVILTGIHLMRTGEINANLIELNELFGLPYVPELVGRKKEGGERGVVSDADMEYHRGECQRLTAELEAARDASSLPDGPSAQPALSDLLVRLRLGNARGEAPRG